jgi:predicted HicB family RNase H-like nuclease
MKIKKQTAVLQIRVSEELKKTAEMKLIEQGKSLSEYIRECLEKI